MLSFNQRMNSSANDCGTSDELDWLVELSEREYGTLQPYPFKMMPPEQQQNFDASVTDQQTMTPENWNQQNFIPTHQTITSPEAFSRSIPVQRQFTPVTHQQKINLNLSRPGFAGKLQHQAKIRLVPNSNGGFKTIVKKKNKRKRTMFTTEQIACLETVFSRKQYVTRDERQILVGQLQVSDNAVKVWFQNRRIRSKREAEEALQDANSSEEFCEATSSDSSPIKEDLFQKVDDNGFVTLEEREMEVLVSAINAALSDDVLFHQDQDFRLIKKEPEESAQPAGSTSFYEPISPASSDCNDEEIEQPMRGHEKSKILQTLFDLHFC